MKELDVVRLIESFNGLSAGTEGTIVEEYDGKYFDVEFVDANGDTLDVVTSPAYNLELVKAV